MARRDFRQLGLADSIVRRRGKKSEWLDRLDAALDWPALERIVAGVYASREGGLAYPLLTYVKLLLLQQWYGLSDEGLEAAVDDRLSFRRFAGIPLAERRAGHRAADHVPGAAQPAAQALADGVQQGGGAGPGRRRAAFRDREADLRLPPGALPRAGAQRGAAPGPVHRHQPAPGARPRAGLRGGVRPVRPRKG